MLSLPPGAERAAVTKRSQRPSIAIIGAGKVGTALGALAVRAGYQVAAIADLDGHRADRAAIRIGVEIPVLAPRQAAGRADLVLLAVPDDAIEASCHELVSTRALARGSLVAHCSGALSSESLAPARQQLDCHVASFHPLQSFPTVEAALENLPGSYCFGEGDELALAALETLGAAIGARCVRIATEHKPLYHAAAVIACNYLAALLDAALHLAASARIERRISWEALGPLIRATVENVSKLGTEGALTGPIARGDRRTITTHLAALKEGAPELSDLYRALGSWTVDLALRKGSIEATDARALLEALAADHDAGEPRGRDRGPKERE
jgi:predicted short-subunit dehydrogenase-like oxidoreductase (DUF2520 family)